jgi:hypothetical protein
VTDSRDNEIKLRLSDAELDRLDELRGAVPRAAFVRSLLRGDPQDPDVASRAEALSILTSLARDGWVSAAIALVRELPPDDGESFDDELARIIRDGTHSRFHAKAGVLARLLDRWRSNAGGRTWRPASVGGCERAARSWSRREARFGRLRPARPRRRQLAA